MLLPEDTLDAFRDGFEQLRADFDVPGPFPDDVLAAAESAATRPLGASSQFCLTESVQPAENSGPSFP